jgi:hypothetical protein
MAGTVCHEHFEARVFDDEITDNCSNCQAAKQVARDFVQQNHTIDPSRPYGQHIAIACRVCGATGSTKNIRPLGCRTIFVNCGHGAADMEVVKS